MCYGEHHTYEISHYYLSGLKFHLVELRSADELIFDNDNNFIVTGHIALDNTVRFYFNEI